MSSPWIAYREQKPCARMRLFCLPYAGGSASMYRRWQAAFPEAVDVCPIEPPGRLGRMNEAPFSEIGSFVRALSDALDPFLDLPFAVFGYSLGALVAFEWVREIARHRGPWPEQVIVAAHHAPHIRTRSLRPTEAMTDRDLLEEIVMRYGPRIRAIGSDPALLAIVMRTMRADLAVIASHRYEEGTPFPSPITVLGGEGDWIASRESLSAWAKHTTGQFTLRMFPGDHFFIHDDEQAVINAVTASLGANGAPAQTSRPAYSG